MLNEADTRAKLVDPKLHEAGWNEEMIERGRHISPGRIIDENGNRKKGTEIDYILYCSSIPLAVVEAEPESKYASSGMGQAKDDAENYMQVLFAYSTNGHEIEEFDFTNNTQKTIDRFPSPEELFKRYQKRIFEERAGESKAPLVYPYYHVLGGKKPWYFQEVAIKKTIEAVLKGKRRILLTMATGSGKTYVALQIVWKLLKSGHLRRVLYLADRTFLRDQAYNEFAPFENARITIEEGRAPKTRDVYFSIYQAMYSGEGKNRLYRQYPRDFFDLIIIDECHRSGYGTWKEILDYFGAAIHLGMTATPKRTDNINTYDYFGEPVFSYSMGKAIEDGFLAPFQIFRSFTNIDRDGLHIQEALYQGAQAFVPEEADLKEIYTLEDFEREIVLPDRTKQICEHLAGLLQTFGALQKTIVYCVNMEHAAQVAKELQNRFAHLGHSDYAVRIVSEEPTAKEDYERFRDSEKTTPVVATTVDLLTTGVDIPSVRNLVFIKPISSKVFFKQHIGRGCRVDPLTNKYFFRIIDYVNAVRLLDGWDYPEGGEPSKIAKGPFDLSLEGLLIDHETQKPIPDARVIAQLAPNMQRTSRTDRNGRFTLTQLPHSPITIHVTKAGFRSRQLTVTPTEGGQPIVIELKQEKPPTKKIVLKGVEVHVAEETKIILTADGKTLTDAEYIEYSRKGVVTRVATLEDLRQIWINTKSRDEFLEELRNESIYPELLAGIAKIPDADAFDMIAHVAFDAPIVTRDERANAFINKRSVFINALGGKAQEIIFSLLDKYRIGGVEQISKPDIFRVPPFDRMGYLRGVAQIFGGFEGLKEALNEVENGLYSEVEAGSK